MVYVVVSFRGCAKVLSAILSETYDKHKGTRRRLSLFHICSMSDICVVESLSPCQTLITGPS